MTLRQPRSIPPARRHAHTSASSVVPSAGNSCHVVVARTTAVGLASASATVTARHMARRLRQVHSGHTGHPVRYSRGNMTLHKEVGVTEPAESVNGSEASTPARDAQLLERTVFEVKRVIV